MDASDDRSSGAARPRGRGRVCVLSAAVLALLAAAGAAPVRAGEAAPPRPNVVIILTDDQGHDELGATGNPVLGTPAIDRLAREGATVARFYVSPVCTPTRASLLTGRWNFRTRAIDTYLGRAMLDPEEVTLAEMLRAGGYATGIFGKWHLGDCYPLRACDQGFEESLVHRGGGLRQPANRAGGDGYFDPILEHNGKPERRRGYCTDIFFDAAAAWIEKVARDKRPFFAYVATNAPHVPLKEVPAAPYERLRQAPGLSDHEARAYAMIENIDGNAGRLLAALERLGIARDTAVFYLHDNGVAGERRNTLFRGKKGTVYEGGLRTPFFARWPAAIRPGTVVARVAAHIDVVPTVLDACGLQPPPGVRLDGRSLLPLLRGAAADWPERTLFFQWHRGNEPVLHRNFAALDSRWKLLRGDAAGGEFELYDLANDPGEMTDLAAREPQVAARLKSEYEAWFRDVGSTRPDNYAAPLIIIGGTEHEEPVLLTRQDLRAEGEEKGWESAGSWRLRIAAAGRYDVLLRFAAPLRERATVTLRAGAFEAAAGAPAGAETLALRGAALAASPCELRAALTGGGEGARIDQVELTAAP